MKRSIKVVLASVAASFVGALGMPLAAHAAPAAFQLQPFEFVGTAAECGGTAGTDTVTAKWDNSTGNPAPSILLQKLGATSNCAAAGVDIVTPLEGGPVSALTELNYDYKNGGHCGAGAPRFNVVVDGNYYFLGCTQGVQTPAGAGWTHVEFGPVQFAAAGIPLTGTLDDVYIIFDEGTDTPTGGTIGTAGTVYLDNISVNGQVVGSPTSPTSKDECKNGGWQNFNPAFKNQGDCVSFVATQGKNPPSSHKH
jgi:hypothetical protein